MQKKNLTSVLLAAKITQLCMIVLIEAAFILLLVCRPSLYKSLGSNPVYLILCFFIWVLLVFSQLFLLYDFFKLRSFIRENQALSEEAYLDSLTGLPNRHGIDAVLKTYDFSDFESVGCYMASIRNLNEINTQSGREAGDKAIHDFARILEEVGSRYGIVGRNGGNEFVVILSSAAESATRAMEASLGEKLDSYNTGHPEAPLQLCSACSLNSELHTKSFHWLLAATYNKLHSQL